MSEARQALLEALLAATGSPPPVESDPETVIDAAEHSALRRAVLLDQIKASSAAGEGGEDPPSSAELALQEAILALDAQWAEALRWARKGLAQRRRSVDRLRRVRALDVP
ncbi:MAG: hypothetical protein IPK13_22325 [Deltaproteobacteria bacterium]|nr:hypothetical protein [Deltaproteobacteria bacterium]